MPYNASGESFFPLGGPFAVSPTLTEPSTYNGLTTAQLAATSGLSSQSVSNASTLVSAAAKRTTGLTVIVPSDGQAVTFGNNNTLAGTISAPPVNPPTQTTFTPGASGFTVPPGVSIFLSPYNDPLYAIVPSGTQTVYFIAT